MEKQCSYFSQLYLKGYMQEMLMIWFTIESDKPTIINPFDYHVNSPKQKTNVIPSIQFSKGIVQTVVQMLNIFSKK